MHSAPHHQTASSTDRTPSRLSRFFASTLTGIFISRFALLGTVMLALTTTINDIGADRDLAAMRKAEQLELKAQKERLVRTIEAVTGDLLVARYSIGLDALLQNPDAQQKKRVTQLLALLLQHKRRYFAAAVLDSRGIEVARVKYNKGQTAIIPHAQLQSRKDQAFYAESARLNNGDVYHSPFDLNIENGAMEEPFRPLIRLATPIRDARGRLSGVFVLAVSGQQLLDRYREEAAQLPGIAYIVNRFGHYLLSPDPREEWGSVIPDRLNSGFGFSDPDAWRKVRVAENGQFNAKSGLLTFETVVPALAVQNFITGRNPPYAEAANAPGEWKLISIVPDATLKQIGNHTRGGAGQLHVAGLFVAAVLAALLAWQRMTRIRGFRAVRDREARLRLVIDNVPAMIAYLDGQERYLLANRSFLEGFGLDESTLQQKSVREVIGPQAYALVEPLLRDALAGNTVRYERRFPAADGAILDLDVTYVPHRDRSGAVRGVFALLVDLTERKRLERARGHFVSMVSHELRAPLASILGSLDEVLDALPPADADTRAMLEMALRNAERLKTIANDVLDLERIESEALKLNPQPTDLHKLVLESVQANRAAADKVRVGLRAVIREEGRVTADPDRLMQVLTNLISNAIKVSPQGEWITVSLERIADRLRACVTDRGPGIAPEFQGRVFERFAQAASSGAAAKSGSGLGLSICKEIIQRSGGQIGFSTLPGSGTTFWFELPLESD